MKLLQVPGTVHLTTDYNPEPGTFKDSIDPDMPRIPGGFSETACGRTIGGAPVEQSLDIVTCAACKGTLAYEQAQQLQQMLNEG